MLQACDLVPETAPRCLASALASAVSPGDLAAARAQMGFSLAWHIVLACLGVGLPILTLAVEWYGIRTGMPEHRLLARRWARAMGVLFAVGAVSGTILSFELGILGPGLMGSTGRSSACPSLWRALPSSSRRSSSASTCTPGTGCRPGSLC